MKRFLARRSAGSWVASVAIHVVVVAALVQMVFRYPLGQLMGLSDPEVTQERLRYITIQQPTENSGGGSTAKAAASPAPAALRAPTAVPNVVATPPSDSSRAVAAGGTGTGEGVAGSGLATGLVPRLPDPRIRLQPGEPIRTPRTIAEDVDSIVDLAIGIVRDSLAFEAGKKKPGDWTVTGKDGEKWGVDGNYIYLGKHKLPSALLALLPLNVGSGTSPIEARSAAYIRRDIMENAQRQISEDEFRAAVKRIRERKEREKREKMLAAEKKPQGQPATP